MTALFMACTVKVSTRLAPVHWLFAFSRVPLDCARPRTSRLEACFWRHLDDLRLLVDFFISLFVFRKSPHLQLRFSILHFIYQEPISLYSSSSSRREIQNFRISHRNVSFSDWSSMIEDFYHRSSIAIAISESN